MYDNPTYYYVDPAYLIEQIHLLQQREELVDALRSLLQAHGASLEEQANGWIVRFPAGTTRRRILPYVQTTRENIVLPDGYLFVYEPAHNGKTNLRIQVHDLPAELVAALRKSDEEASSHASERTRSRARADPAQYPKDTDSGV